MSPHSLTVLALSLVACTACTNDLKGAATRECEQSFAVFLKVQQPQAEARGQLLELRRTAPATFGSSEAFALDAAEGVVAITRERYLRQCVPDLQKQLEPCAEYRAGSNSELQCVADHRPDPKVQIFRLIWETTTGMAAVGGLRAMAELSKDTALSEKVAEALKSTERFNRPDCPDGMHADSPKFDSCWETIRSAAAGVEKSFRAQGY